MRVSSGTHLMNAFYGLCGLALVLLPPVAGQERDSNVTSFAVESQSRLDRTGSTDPGFLAQFEGVQSFTPDSTKSVPPHETSPGSYSFQPTSTTSGSDSLPASDATPSVAVVIATSDFTSRSISTADPSQSDRSVTSTSSIPIQSSDSPSGDISTILTRRLEIIIASATQATSIAAWLSTLQRDGSWPDVDYTTGCDAQRANWPAGNHWQRILTMTSAFHGGLEDATQWVGDSNLLEAISLSMDFWFSNDMANDNCVDAGGSNACPCGTPGFWNTNWFSNLLLIPDRVARSCLLVHSTLTATQLGNCTHIPNRAYATFERTVIGLGTYTGANTLDLASIGIDLGLLTGNLSLIDDAYRRVHDEVVIQNAAFADGIRPDGSFGQHGGLIYNGNYGKDYANAVFELEIASAGTEFQADETSRTAFETLVDGDQWMIHLNVETGVLHWDFSVLGRFISFPVADNQATGSIKINTTQLSVLGELWNSASLLEVYGKLTENSSTANTGDIAGNRIFYANDYLVHRGPGYVSALRMYSTRTKNTECLNSQSPLGFHLSDGTLYTYLTGSEYEDIAASWDWNLIPGITVDYNATPLSCGTAEVIGIESFVGGASTGSIGLGAMRYTNPRTSSISWQKAWFFLEGDVQHVMINILSSATNSPVYSVLDQRKHTSDLIVDGLSVESGNFSHASALWHGNVGYTFPPNSTASLNIDSGPRTGDWSVLGISTQPPTTVDLFSAWLTHTNLDASVSYTIFPAVDYNEFLGRAATTLIVDVQNDADVSAILDVVHKTAMIVFWGAEGGEVIIPPLLPDYAPVSVSANTGLLVVLQMETWNLTVSDPTQNVAEAEVTLQLESGEVPAGWSGERTKSVSVTLPIGGLAGSSVSVPLF